MSPALSPRTPETLAATLVERLLDEPAPRPLRLLLDGVGSGDLARSLVPGLAAAGRPALLVHAEDFQRPAGERYEWGREDTQALREVWLDTGALEREVLDAALSGSVLPALWDAARDRSARAAPVPVPAQGAVLVDGVFLLDRGLSADLTVHVALSPAALLRRGVPTWQLPAFREYDEQVRPGERCDVLVRAEDPLRPAVLVR